MKIKMLSTSLLMLIVMLFSFNAFAKNVYAKLTLLNLVNVQSTESGSDEIYFDVGEFLHNDSSHYRIPPYPKHWVVKSDQRIVNQTLWEGRVEEEHPVNLMITIAEEDQSYFNPDDAIGSIKVNVTNNRGELKFKWSANANGTQLDKAISEKTQRYTLKSDKGEYLLELQFSPIEKLDRKFMSQMQAVPYLQTQHGGY